MWWCWALRCFFPGWSGCCCVRCAAALKLFKLADFLFEILSTYTLRARTDFWHCLRENCTLSISSTSTWVLWFNTSAVPCSVSLHEMSGQSGLLRYPLRSQVKRQSLVNRKPFAGKERDGSFHEEEEEESRIGVHPRNSMHGPAASNSGDERLMRRTGPAKRDEVAAGTTLPLYTGRLGTNSPLSSLRVTKTRNHHGSHHDNVDNDVTHTQRASHLQEEREHYITSKY